MGSITKVDPRVLRTLLDGGYLPVVSPIARSEEGGALNCNADDAARAVAEAMGADKLIFLTDTDGILVDSHNQSTRIAKMDVNRAKELMDSGLIAGGMIPKTRNCIHAVEHGVGSVTVLDGRMEHAILLEAISEKSLGTTWRRSDPRFPWWGNGRRYRLDRRRLAPATWGRGPSPRWYGPYRPCLLDRPRGAAPRGGCLPAASISHVRNGGKNTRGLRPWTPVFKAARCSLALFWG